MSNHLALATVTATLRLMLQDRIQGAVPGAQVRTVRPDAIARDPQARGVNLYLYQVNPNTSFRNLDVATRRSDGSLMQRPQIAVDAMYLLSFFGAEEQLEPQRLLGVAVSTLHTWPELGRDAIQAAIVNAPTAFLNGSDLGAQPVTIKLTMETLTTDELSKIWSVFFQTPYQLSVAYRASVVLLEAEEAFPRPALPTRGARATSGPTASPWIDQLEPAIVAGGNGATIRVRGRNLIGGDVVAVVDGQPASARAEEDGSLVVSLPPGVRAGPRALRVVNRGAGDGAPSADSNPAALVVQPRLTGEPAVGSIVDPRTGNSVRVVTVPVVPEVGPRQRALLHLNEYGSMGRPFGTSSDRLLRFDIAPTHAGDLDGRVISSSLREEFRRNAIELGDAATIQVDVPGQRWAVLDAGQRFAARLSEERIVVYLGIGAGALDHLAFQLPDVPPGSYLVRVEVDGVSSELASDPESGVYNGPRVTL